MTKVKNKKSTFSGRLLSAIAEIYYPTKCRCQCSCDKGKSVREEFIRTADDDYIKKLLVKWMKSQDQAVLISVSDISKLPQVGKKTATEIVDIAHNAYLKTLGKMRASNGELMIAVDGVPSEVRVGGHIAIDESGKIVDPDHTCATMYIGQLPDDCAIINGGKIILIRESWLPCWLRFENGRLSHTQV